MSLGSKAIPLKSSGISGTFRDRQANNRSDTHNISRQANYFQPNKFPASFYRWRNKFHQSATISHPIALDGLKYLPFQSFQAIILANTQLSNFKA